MMSPRAAGLHFSICLAALAAVLPACTTLFGPPEDTPPPALTARFVRSISPNMREQMWTPLFDGRDYVSRLICPSGDWLTSKLLEKKGLVESYEVSCPGESPHPLSFDVGYDPPPPPDGCHLLEPTAFAKYREAFASADQKQFDTALEQLDEAVELAPKEWLYQRDRIYLLYEMGRISQAFLEAEELGKAHPSAVLYKYRALAARDLGLQSEVISSLDGMIQLTHAGHPLYAEAVCSKGLILAGQGDPKGMDLMQQGCALDYKICCDALKSRPTQKSHQQSAQAQPAAGQGTAEHHE